VVLPELTDEALRDLPADPATQELRLAAAILWYDRRLISQGRAAEIAGVSRVEFIRSLSRYGVSPFQETADEIVEAFHNRR
jgi:predicted HTH domain antitoxin